MVDEVRGPLPVKVDATSNGEFRPVPVAEHVAQANAEAELQIGEHAKARRTWTQGIFTIALRCGDHVAYVE